MYAPVIIITKAVIVQTTMVSINGSRRATTPSCTGSELFAAEWAIAAEPTLLHLKKLLSLLIINTPKKPPNAASEPVEKYEKADGIWEK